MATKGQKKSRKVTAATTAFQVDFTGTRLTTTQKRVFERKIQAAVLSELAKIDFGGTRLPKLPPGTLGMIIDRPKRRL